MLYTYLLLKTKTKQLTSFDKNSSAKMILINSLIHIDITSASTDG